MRTTAVTKIAAPADARQYARVASFPMHRGGLLRDAVIAYETWGELNAARDNAILVFTGLSASAHAMSSPGDASPGWWQYMIGPQRALDTSRFFVICVNSLGSCFGSSSPLTTNPGTGQAYRLQFPELAVEDIARGGYEALRSLGIGTAATVIGASLGGMTVLAFADLFPGAARRLISISGTAAASPVAIALRSVQREAILSDAQWQNGNYRFDAPPRIGMRLARKLGTITYRSAHEWNERFGRNRLVNRDSTPFSREFAVEGFLEAQAEKFVHAFDANCYLYLSRAMDKFELPTDSPGLAELNAALIIGVDTDMLFRPEEQRELAQRLGALGVATTAVEISSAAGHDAFLVDTAPFAAAIGKFLA